MEEVIQIPQIVHWQGRCHCPFCGREMLKVVHYDRYKKTVEYKCGCADWVKLTDLQSDIERIKISMPKQKFGIKTLFGEL